MKISDKRAAALSICDSYRTYEKEHCLSAYWNDFIPYMLPPPCDHENDRVEWVEDRFEVLYKAATQWIILDLMARIETLENPTTIFGHD